MKRTFKEIKKKLSKSRFENSPFSIEMHIDNFSNEHPQKPNIRYTIYVRNFDNRKEFVHGKSIKEVMANFRQRLKEQKK